MNPNEQTRLEAAEPANRMALLNYLRQTNPNIPYLEPENNTIQNNKEWDQDFIDHFQGVEQLFSEGSLLSLPEDTQRRIVRDHERDRAYYNSLYTLSRRELFRQDNLNTGVRMLDTANNPKFQLGVSSAMREIIYNNNRVPDPNGF